MRSNPDNYRMIQAMAMLFFVALFLAACTPGKTSVPVTSNATQSPSATISALRDRTPTPGTPRPSPAHPDSTPTYISGQGTFGYKSTQRALATGAILTQEAVQYWDMLAKLQQAVQTAVPPVVVETNSSPDNKWKVELVRYDCVDVGAGDGVTNAYEQLFLIDLATEKKTMVADQFTYCEGIGAYGLKFVSWSADSRYLYYTEAAYGVPDGGGYGWYRPLSRYDLQSGETIALAWGPLTPDGVTMAYPDYQGQALYLWDMDRGEIARIPSSLSPSSPLPKIYGIAWAADGKSLVFVEAECADCSGKASIVFLDVASLNRQVIYQVDSGMLFCCTWTSDRQIQFQVNDEPKQSILIPLLPAWTIAPPGATDLDMARNALLTFFTLLHDGRYAEAVPLYGGDYETLRIQNPDVSPEDYAALWQASCTRQTPCLLVSRIVEEKQVSQDLFEFSVEFIWKDGALFKLGPCCGATETEMPPVWQFAYTVMKSDGQYKVMQGPVYIP